MDEIMKMELPLHAAIILAAGASRRLGTAKQLLSNDGESLLRRATRMAQETNPMQTLVVLGHDSDTLFATINDMNIQRVDCAEWSKGMGASLRSGMAQVSAECDGALILLCDQIELSTKHLHLLCNIWQQQPEHAVASVYANTMGVPALLPRSWFDRIASLQGDHGARDLLRSDPSVIGVLAPELARDIDTTQDLLG